MDKGGEEGGRDRGISLDIFNVHIKKKICAIEERWPLSTITIIGM